MQLDPSGTDSERTSVSVSMSGAPVHGSTKSARAPSGPAVGQPCQARLPRCSLANCPRFAGRGWRPQTKRGIYHSKARRLGDSRNVFFLIYERFLENLSFFERGRRLNEFLLNMIMFSACGTRATDPTRPGHFPASYIF